MTGKTAFRFPDFSKYSNYITLVGFPALLYFLGTGCVRDNLTPLEQLYLITGSLGCAWVSFVFCNVTTSVMAVEHARAGGWGKAVFSIIGVLIGICVGFTAIFLVMSPMMMHSVAPNQLKPGAIDRMFYLFIFTALGTAYLVACYFWIWTRFVVRDKVSVIQRGKMFYPGEQYRRWVNPDDSRVIHSIVTTEKCDFVYTHSTVATYVTAEVALDLERAKVANVRELDVEAFEKGVVEWFWKHFQSRLHQQTAEETLTGQMEPVEETIAGFPVYWDGTFLIETRK